MESKRILDVLNQARRALDALSQIEIIDDWRFENELNVWYLHFSIAIECETIYFPRKSQWYVVVESNYPKGKIKVYPDVNKSITTTLYHQANNSTIEKNGLWRKGALCLEINTIPAFQSEPHTIDERLLYHVKRAIFWLELAAKEQLVTDKEPFELPEFPISNFLETQFVFSEDAVSFMQWDSVECRYGIAELDVYKKDPLIYYVKLFKSINNKIQHYTEWGKYLSKGIILPPIKAPWILLNRIPVINDWQTPETFGELVLSCQKQHIDLMNILEKIVSSIRDGKRHIFLIGFPIPKFFGGEPEIIFWKALYLPVVSYGNKTAKGFRSNPKGWWMRDKTEVFTDNLKLDWIISENWSQQEISQRGKMNGILLRKSILIVGAGCIGAAIAEILVRAGVYSITIADSDIFEVGNLSRHILNINDIGGLKESALCNHLNSISPHANVEVINHTLYNDDVLVPNIDLDKYDIIIDCTGENSVLDVFQCTDFKRNHIIASISVGLGAKRLYISFMKGTRFNFESFYNVISPYLQLEKDLYDDYNLPRNGIGCWHPTFPGRSDDIWLAASVAVKAFEKYIESASFKNLTLVYEQRENNGIFESYEVVDKREDG